MVFWIPKTSWLAAAIAEILVIFKAKCPLYRQVISWGCTNQTEQAQRRREACRKTIKCIYNFAVLRLAVSRMSHRRLFAVVVVFPPEAISLFPRPDLFVRLTDFARYKMLNWIKFDWLTREGVSANQPSTTSRFLLTLSSLRRRALMPSWAIYSFVPNRENTLRIRLDFHAALRETFFAWILMAIALGYTSVRTACVWFKGVTVKKYLWTVTALAF